MYWLTNPSSGEELPNIDCIVTVFPGTKKNDGRPDPYIKSRVKPVKALRDLLENRCNLKGSLVFYPYRWPDELTEFSGSRKIQIDWKDYQGVIHNTYYGRNIETDHYVICSMPEYVAKNLAFPNFTTPMPGTLR